MSKLNVIVTPTAETDMVDIFNFIARDNINKAIEMIDIFEEKFETLSQFSHSGFRKSYFVKHDIRECIVAKHYQIIYTVKNNKLYILRILTGYQDIFA